MVNFLLLSGILCHITQSTSVYESRRAHDFKGQADYPTSLFLRLLTGSLNLLANTFD